MKRAIFLYNKSACKVFLEKARIPYKVIGFGYVEGALYECRKDYIGIDIKTELKNHKGFNKIYGIICVIDKEEFYMKTLDSINCCSRTTFKKNHDMDMMHRVKKQVTPIYFNSIEEFLVMKYKEGDKIAVESYFANIKNKNIVKVVANKRKRFNIGITPEMLNEYSHILKENNYGKVNS